MAWRKEQPKMVRWFGKRVVNLATNAKPAGRSNNPTSFLQLCRLTIVLLLLLLSIVDRDTKWLIVIRNVWDFLAHWCQSERTSWKRNWQCSILFSKIHTHLPGNGSWIKVIKTLEYKQFAKIKCFRCLLVLILKFRAIFFYDFVRSNPPCIYIVRVVCQCHYVSPYSMISYKKSYPILQMIGIISNTHWSQLLTVPSTQSSISPIPTNFNRHYR